MSIEKNKNQEQAPAPKGTITFIAGDLSFHCDALKFDIDVYEMQNRLARQGKSLTACIGILESIKVGGDDPQKLREPSRIQYLQGMEEALAEQFIKSKEVFIKKN